jgi:hypothetical protein
MTDAAPSASKPGTRAYLWIALFAILSLATFVRLYRLDVAGIFSIDEGRYLLDGQSTLNEWRVYTNAIHGKWSELTGGPPFSRSAFVAEADGHLKSLSPFFPKVLFSHAIAGMVSVFGFKTWCGNAVEAVFGVGCILALFVLVRSLSGFRTALLASGLLAISPFHVFFSRNSYPQCMPLFFVLLAVYAHVVATRRFLNGPPGCKRPYVLWCLAGACIGAALASNYQVAAVLPAFPLLHLAVMRHAESWHRRALGFAGGAVAISLGFAFILLACELQTYPLLLLFRSEGQVWPHPTFFELLAPRLTSHSSEPFNVSGLLLYPYFLWQYDGFAPIIIAIALLAVRFLPRQLNATTPENGTVSPFLWDYLLIMSIVPWLIFSTKTLQAGRTFVFCHPFFLAAAACLLAKLWSERLPNSRTTKTALPVIVVAFVACADLPGLSSVLTTRSGMLNVIEYVRKQGDAAAYASFSTVLECYLREAGLPGGNVHFSANKSGHGTNLLVVDFLELYDGRYPDEAELIKGVGKPAFETQHEVDARLLNTEFFPGHGNSLRNIQHVRELDLARARKVLVYPLGQQQDQLLPTK